MRRREVLHCPFAKLRSVQPVDAITLRPQRRVVVVGGLVLIAPADSFPQTFVTRRRATLGKIPVTTSAQTEAAAHRRGAQAADPLVAVGDEATVGAEVAVAAGAADGAL